MNDVLHTLRKLIVIVLLTTFKIFADLESHIHSIYTEISISCTRSSPSLRALAHSHVHMDCTVRRRGARNTCACTHTHAHARARGRGESGCAARISDCRDTLHCAWLLRSPPRLIRDGEKGRGTRFARGEGRKVSKGK